ncbi:MAG: hypothetical protein QGH59_02405, partial [Gemmatimonadota bacterium]|nr:hypothetical protein [Gemmatimonadota bacterium]
MAVDFESTGVVILLEVRPLGGALQSVPDDLAPVQDAARRMLASPGAGARWLPASEDGLAGQMDVEDVAAALPLLHALRTSLRQDPAAVPLGITAGLGIGGGVEASGLAGAAFRSLDQSKRPGTRGLTPDPRINAGLDALFRT